ncbi:MAG: hypothetical protein S4CHLAM45_04270 [Chlamydiales bacterium]|nr:hypothetical protein [Chlamydiales bacterium]MCH9619281.1 hypothetical protein [Chlamydiales bacterium]MCH9622543.1 hypothetical protein [Chlamydiales bacterium]
MSFNPLIRGNVSISTWGSCMQGISDDTQKLLGIDRKGNVQLIDRKNPPKGFKRLTLDQIISLTLEVFENSNTISESDRSHITNGLSALIVKKRAKYKELHLIRKFFAGKRIKRQIEEDVKKTNYVESLIHVGHKYSNRLLRDFEQEIPPGLAPEVIEATIATLIKDQKITDVEANYSTLYTMCEEAANKYFAKNDIHSAFRVRMLIAKQLGLTLPLKDISKLDNHHLDSLDTSVLKNGSMHVKKMTIDGKPYTRLMFKVNPHERKRLKTTIAKLKKESNRRGVERLLPKFTFLQVRNESDGYYPVQPNNTFKSKNFYRVGAGTNLQFDDMGIIRIGDDPDVYTHYNRVQIFIPADSTDMEKKVHTMLSVVGLGGVLFAQRQMDDERMKIFHLLRYFHPRKARTFETDPHYFSISPYHLQRDIIAKIPSMKEVFMTHLVDQPELMYKQEIYPGKEVWAIKGGADSIRKVGGIGIMSGVGSRGLKINAFKTIAKILEHGSMSSQDRFENGWIAHGISSKADLEAGGGDHVYTRLVTRNDIDQRSIDSYYFSGHVQVLYDLKLLERGGFAFRSDQYGSKKIASYRRRLNFVSLARKLMLHGSSSNEFMIKNRIPPKYIKGLVVPTETDKAELLSALRKAGRIERKGEQEFIKNIDVLASDFIHVGTRFQTKMWGTSEEDLPLTEPGTEVISAAEVKGFPPSLKDVGIINKSIGGSTGAQIVGKDGTQWVSKTGMSPSHCLNEYHANKAYKALDVRVPEVKAYWKSSKDAIIHGKKVEKQQVVMLSQHIDGKPLKKYLSKCNLDGKMEVYRKIQENFVADCLFANWDVIGQSIDNILIDSDGFPWRIDNGGALEYRARGGAKGPQWASKVKELTTLRNQKINPQTTKVFAGISDQAIIDQINEIVAKKEDLLSVIPERLKRVMIKRIDYLIQYRNQLEIKKDERNEQVQKQLNEAKSIVIFDKKYASDKLMLNETSLKSTPARDWGKIQDVNIKEPPYHKKNGYKVSAGVIIQEPDGRYWLFEPKGHYGGYRHTFPKGRQEKGLTMQQTALKEAWEESGLHVEITDFLCDQTRGTTHTRYYLAKRLSGDPSDAHWESAKVKLVPKDQLHKLLNKKYDKKLLEQLGG